MADYYGTTASSGAKIKKGKAEALKEYLAGWELGEVNADVSEDYINVYGYEDFSPAPLATKERAEEDEYLEEGEADYDLASADAFLSGLVPFLEVEGQGDVPENGGKADEGYLIVIQTVGSEKCRFPLGACEFVLRPNGNIEYNTFKY